MTRARAGSTHIPSIVGAALLIAAAQLLSAAATRGERAYGGDAKAGVGDDLIFADGFESGDTSAWSQTVTRVTVPAVVGLQRQAAEAVLLAAGLVVGVVDEVLWISAPTGEVVGQDPTAASVVSAGSAVDLFVVAAPPAGTAVPAGWTGRWRITTSYLSPASGQVTAEEEVFEVICPADPLGWALLEAAFPGDASCSGAATHTSITSSCSVALGVDGCTIDATVMLAVDRSGNTLSGTGDWSAISGCAPGTPGEAIVVAGTRLGTHHGFCQGPVSSLLQKLVQHPLGMIAEPLP